MDGWLGGTNLVGCVDLLGRHINETPPLCLPTGVVWGLALCLGGWGSSISCNMVGMVCTLVER